MEYEQRHNVSPVIRIWTPDAEKNSSAYCRMHELADSLPFLRNLLKSCGVLEADITPGQPTDFDEYGSNYTIILKGAVDYRDAAHAIEKALYREFDMIGNVCKFREDFDIPSSMTCRGFVQIVRTLHGEAK